jgi:hypothetical protein
VVVLARSSRPRHARTFALAGLISLLVAGGAQSALAHRTDLAVDVLPDQATVAPDGRSVFLNITTRCDRKWNVVDARVTVTQPGGSGEGPFTPACNRITTVVGVTVPVLQGSFSTGSIQATAILIVQQSKRKEARDSAQLRARPSVSVQAADVAVLEGAGETVRIGVTVTCPPAAIGRGGQITVYDGRVAGTGFFGPTPCDRLPHTISVRVPASQGAFSAGSAQAEAFASVEEGGDIFPGGDLRIIQITQP